LSEVVLQGVMTSTPASARSVAERFGFAFCTSAEEEIWDDKINTVFIATRHDSHASYVIKALKAGKHIFVEKPLCITESQLNEIADIYSTINNQQSTLPLLMVGFNRRFSALTALLKEKIGDGPMAMIYRVNAGRIPNDSWIQDPERGGGRIVGEVCHFVDYLTYLNGSLPVAVFANVLRDSADCGDTVTINLQFQNGSIGTIAYVANGSKELFKEYIEVHQAGVTAVLKDFKELHVFRSGRPYSKKLISQDKGQKEMVKTFVEAVRVGGEAPISFADIYTVTLSTFKIMESIRKNMRIEIHG